MRQDAEIMSGCKCYQWCSGHSIPRSGRAPDRTQFQVMMVMMMMMSRAPATAMSVLASARQAPCDVGEQDEELAGEIISELVQAQEKLHQDVHRRVAAERRRSRELKSTEAMEACQVEDTQGTM